MRNNCSRGKTSASISTSHPELVETAHSDEPDARGLVLHAPLVA